MIPKDVVEVLKYIRNKFKSIHELNKDLNKEIVEPLFSNGFSLHSIQEGLHYYVMLNKGVT